MLFNGNIFPQHIVLRAEPNRWLNVIICPTDVLPVHQHSSACRTHLPDHQIHHSSLAGCGEEDEEEEEEEEELAYAVLIWPKKRPSLMILRTNLRFLQGEP